MGIFSRKRHQDQQPVAPEETTLQRKVMIAQQNSKLRRAELLKMRSARVVANLNDESRINNYAWRLRQAAENSIALERGTAHVR